MLPFLSRFTSPSHRCKARRGFTLIEAGLATIIVGLGVVAAVQLCLTCTKQNSLGVQKTTAMFLANNIREAMAGLSFNDPITANKTFGKESGETLATFNDIDDFDGASFNPPIDSTRTTLASLTAYTQEVSVVPIYPNKLTVNPNDAPVDIPKTTYTGAVRIQVKIKYKPRPTDPSVEVYRASWIRVDG